MAKVLGYARISTDAQDAVSQEAMLHQHGAVVVFKDTGDGSKIAGRDQLEAALRLLERGDTLLAIHPDRLARDTADLLTIGKRVVEKGAVLRILDPAIVFDGQDIMAEAMLTVFGLIGRIEKPFIKERQRRRGSRPRRPRASTIWMQSGAAVGPIRSPKGDDADEETGLDHRVGARPPPRVVQNGG